MKMVLRLIQPMSMADDTYELKQFNSLTLIVKVTVFLKDQQQPRKVTLVDGKEVYVATVYDLMTSQYGIKRFNHELEATSYDDL